MNNLPAHETKELDIVDYLLPNGARVDIEQDGSSPDSTGRTIWLGAQILAVYLHDLLGPIPGLVASADGKERRRQRVVDVGAGTGLSSLSLASMGYDVLSTDLGIIVDGVLSQNLEANTQVLQLNSFGQPRIQAKVLDWFQNPTDWEWPTKDRETLVPPFDLIVTADTVYDPSLSQPLLRTLHGLSTVGDPTSPTLPRRTSSSSIPPIYLALEARDPLLISSFIESAAKDWNFKCSRVQHGRLKKLVENDAGGLGWEDEAVWEGVEVWKLKLRKR